MKIKNLALIVGTSAILGLGSCAPSGKIGNGGIYQGNVFCKYKPTKIKSNHNTRYTKAKGSHYKKHRDTEETFEPKDKKFKGTYIRHTPSFL